jgi:hypothetical protein
MMDRDEMIRGMIDQGIPRHKAEAEADRLLAESARQLEPSPFARVSPPPGFVRSEMDSDVRQAMTAPIWPKPGAWQWPFRMVLPWSHLISDNRKYAPALRGGKPALILTVEYRAAKRLAGQAARRAWGEGSPYADGLLELTARVFFPNDYRKRDAHNFQKCAHDALKGIVIEDDDILVPRWIPAGVDVDAPRAELTFNPYPPV